MKVSRYRTYFGIAALAIVVPLMAAAAAIERAAVFVWTLLVVATAPLRTARSTDSTAISVRHSPLDPALLNGLAHERGFHRLASARGG